MRYLFIYIVSRILEWIKSNWEICGFFNNTLYSPVSPNNNTAIIIIIIIITIYNAPFIFEKSNPRRRQKYINTTIKRLHEKHHIKVNLAIWFIPKWNLTLIIKTVMLLWVITTQLMNFLVLITDDLIFSWCPKLIIRYNIIVIWWIYYI